MDHEQFLGDTLAKIAGEKAGIIKKGVPCVVGPQDDEALEVIETAATRLAAPLVAHGQHWHVWEERGRLVFQDERGLADLPLPNLPGAHQIDNAGAALAALRHLGFDEAAQQAAVARAAWPARMQRLAHGPLVDVAPHAELWLDGGHNAAAGEALARHLATLPKRPTYLICGMLKTKDVTGYLRPLAEQATRLMAISIPGEANTLPADVTAATAEAVNLPADTVPSAYAALERITQRDPKARVLICGSLYLAGTILRENG
jgi:dihydrofolate synthase/folylpolyglutamate synthase